MPVMTVDDLESVKNVVGVLASDGASATSILGGGKLLPDGKVIPWLGFNGELTDGADAIIRRGSLKAERQPGLDIEFTEEGLCVLTEEIACEYADVKSVLANIGKYEPHPDFPLLGMERCRVHREAGEEARITLTYCGMPGSTSWPPTEEVINNTSTEPIETWYGFNNYVSGHDISTDADGNFKGILSGVLKGVDSYMVPNTILRRRWTQKARPQQLNIVAKIFWSLGDAPYIDGIWFCAGLTWIRRGLAYVCAADFMNSGPNTGAAFELYG